MFPGGQYAGGSNEVVLHQKVALINTHTYTRISNVYIHAQVCFDGAGGGGAYEIGDAHSTGGQNISCSYTA